MRVLIVVNDLDVGGSERQALLLARILAERGRTVALAGLSGNGPLEEECRRAGIDSLVCELRNPLSLYYLPRNLVPAAAMMRRWRPDVILPFTSVPNMYASLLWKVTTARACIWNQRDAGLYRPGRVVERIASRIATAHVANSESGREFLIRVLRVPPGKVHLVRNGVTPPPSEGRRREWRTRLGLRRGDFLGCMIGSLKPPKDHGTLLAAWGKVVEHLRGKGRRAILLLAGRKGEAYEPLRKRAEEGGLGDRVRFLGHVEDVYGLLSAVDIGLFSSRSEGLPNGVLEVMAAGLPVVASDLPGVRECLGGGRREGLFPVGDAEAMAAIVIGLADDDGERSALGERNRRRVEEDFSPRVMGDLFEGLIGACVPP